MDDEEKEESTTPLRLKREAPEAEVATKPCPKCGAAMPADGVLCVQCGYDTRSGATIKAASHVSHTLMVIVGVVAGVLIAAIAILVLIRVFKKDAAPLIPAPESVPAATAPVSPPPPPPAHVALVDAPVPEAQPRHEPEARQPEPEAPVTPATPPDVPAKPEPDADEAPVPSDDEPEAEPEAEPEPDPAQQAEEIRRSLRASMDERIPVFQIGDEVALRQRTGFVHRGRLYAIGDGTATVIDEDIRTSVRLDELDHDSRVQIDQAYRDRLVESRLRAILRNER